MAKQRNSLGVVVLPIPEQEITWEEYKDRYGIDLNEVVSYSEEDAGLIINKTKLVYLSGLLSVIGWSPEVVPVVVSFKSQIHSGDDVIGYSLHLGVLVSPDDDDGTALNLVYLGIYKYTNGDPDKVNYVEV